MREALLNGVTLAQFDICFVITITIMDALRQRREPYQSCLEGASEKKVACHTIRLSEDVWVKWCAYKTFMNASSNNETASKLLDMWQVFFILFITI